MSNFLTSNVIFPNLKLSASNEHKKEIRVLVLGAGGNVSQGIIKALRETGLSLRIIGACIWEYSKGLYMCDEGYICPYAADDRFLPWVIDFCNEHEVDIIFTGVEENIIKLARNVDLIKSKTKTVFISSSYEQLIVGQDKYLTCRFLEQAGCNYPRYHLWTSLESAKEFAEKAGYPIIAKPRSGKGSRGIYILNSATDIEKQNHLENYVLEQCIGHADSEYTVGCYVNKNGVLQKIFPMKRKLFNGTTVWAKTVENQIIMEECIKICEAFKPRGPLNIQMRLDQEGKPVCFELNVRFSGTTAIRSHLGFKDVKAVILEYICDEDISNCFNIQSGEVFRFDEELYLSENTTETMRERGLIEDISSFYLPKGS